MDIGYSFGPVVQGIVYRFPEPRIQVRVLAGLLFSFKISYQTLVLVQNPGLPPERREGGLSPGGATLFFQNFRNKKIQVNYKRAGLY
jgi:hypothetical protein